MSLDLVGQVKTTQLFNQISWSLSKAPTDENSSHRTLHRWAGQADRVADRVMSRPNPKLQRQSEEDETVSTKPPAAIIKPLDIR